jgi:hypothetical protein
MHTPPENKERGPAKDVFVLRVEPDVVAREVCLERVSPEHLGDLDELVVVVVPVEERLLPEQLRGVSIIG